MDSLPISAPDRSPGATANSVKSDDSSPRHDPGRGSPPPNCAICLGTCRNKSFTDSCLHQFCFKCLLTWSKVKAECPLCKQNFRSIIHNVRSNHQYEEYMVEQRHTEELSERIDIDNLTASRRFRYRTTLTLPRQNTIAIQQLLLHHYPMVAELFPGPPAPRRRSPASFRRTVYRYNLWARPLPDFTSRFRDCSPGFYRHNPSQMHRLVPWLNRELHYLLNENVGHIAYVVARILELLPQYCINSTEFRDTMRRYFGDNTDHFLHELYCFASTPYDMNGYDRHVQYTTDHTISTIVSDVLSSSESDASVDSDIVVISSSAPADAPPGPSRPARPPRPARAPAPVYPQSYITDGDGVIPIETISQSDTDDDSSEVMVVGYIKPPRDRTPEVVDLLGSDSDVVVQEGEAADGRAASLVKLTLARRAASGSEGARTPSATPPPRVPSSRSSSSSSSSSASDSDFLPSLTDSEEDARRKAKWTTSRRKPAPERSKRRAKRRSRKHRKSKRESNVSPGREKQCKHKSHSGKGVKSSRKCGTGENETAPVYTERGQPLDQPGTSGLSRGASRDVSTSHDPSAMSYGTSEIFRNASEISSSMSDIFSRIASEMSHGTSEILSRITSEMSRGTSELSSSTSDVTRNEVSRAPTEMTHFTSEISSSTNDISRSTSEVSRGTSEISRGLSELSRGSCGISRGSRGTSHSASDILPGTSELSRGINDISCGTSGPWRGTKRKLESNTRRRESKRLKSVVNVVKRHKMPELASPVGAERATDSDSEYKPTDSEPSDSDDDLPLNLSIARGAR